MPRILNPSYAPHRVTTVQIIPGNETNEVRSEPPPGWTERHRARLGLRRGSTPDATTRDDNFSEDCGSPPFDPIEENPRSSKDPHPPAPAEPKPKTYVFSKRKIYNTRFTKYWIVRRGEPLSSPPPEVDASGCSGPAIFVNVQPDGDRKIWLWSVDRKMWDVVFIKHVVDLDGGRQLDLNAKDIPVFIPPRGTGRKRRVQEEAENSGFIHYVAPP